MSKSQTIASQAPDIIAEVVKLSRPMPKVLGMGAHLKASVCLIDGDEAFVTHPAGDMETLEAVEAYQALLAEMLERAGQGEPLNCAAHDLHPNFYTTTFAKDLECPTLAVQHHHAHILATVAEHQCEDPVIGLALDGFGLGPNDESWGGELLWVDGLDFARIGHLGHLAQPGGDIAAREPWRMGAAALHALGRGDEIEVRFHNQPHAHLLASILDKGLNSPVTSSCGRVFDAACGLLGVREVAEFEGQAPMQLEALATSPFVVEGGWHLDQDGILDLRPLLTVISEMDQGDGANAFHGTLAAALCEWVGHACDARNVKTVAFGGGCFFNHVLTDLLCERLGNQGAKVLMPKQLSAGDAGLSFGQAYACALSVESNG